MYDLCRPLQNVSFIHNNNDIEEPLYLYIMAQIIKIALERQRYDLAAHALLLGLIQTTFDDRKSEQKTEETRILRQGAE
jgi:hypothetical protein